MATEPHFEVFPEVSREAPTMGAPTGEFVWHFQDANGDITFGGEESYTRREDAHRSIRGAAYDVIRLVIRASHGIDLVLPIVDLDADGEPIVEE